MSPLPAANHRWYWPNWAVVHAGTGTNLTVWPVFDSHCATIFLKFSTELPTTPDTYVISAAETADTPGAKVFAATVALKNEVI